MLEGRYGRALLVRMLVWVLLLVGLLLLLLVADDGRGGLALTRVARGRRGDGRRVIAQTHGLPRSRLGLHTPVPAPASVLLVGVVVVAAGVTDVSANLHDIAVLLLIRRR